MSKKYVRAHKEKKGLNLDALMACVKEHLLILPRDL